MMAVITSAFVSISKRKKIFERDGYKCLCCGSVENLTIDHIIPVSKGGKAELGNLQTLCYSCNQKKGADIIDYTDIMLKLVGGEKWDDESLIKQIKLKRKEYAEMQREYDRITGQIKMLDNNRKSLAKKISKKHKYIDQLIKQLNQP